MQNERTRILQHGPGPLSSSTDLQKALYNPGLLSREGLLRTFVARKTLLQELKAQLERNTAGTAGQQHILLVGPRGMGKTTLLLRLRYLVEDTPHLSSRWQPILFLEENYGLGDLADFWLEALRHLPALPGGSSPEEKASRLFTRFHRDPDRLSEAALEAVRDEVRRRERELLFLVDNLQEIFRHIHDERQLHQLRATLMQEPWLKLIGCAPSYFEQIELADAPFYEFFRVQTLDGVSLEETVEIFEQWAAQDGQIELARRFSQRHGRIRSLHRLTGGNPRLVAVLYELFRDGPLCTAFEDLEQVVDRMTPYFKAQTDALAVQARRVVDALARRWDPTPAGEIAIELRLPSNQVSAQLSKLKKDGWVEGVGEGRIQRYQLVDRFYNVCYLVRYARGNLDRLKGFVRFLHVLYEDDDLATLAGNMDKFIRTLPLESQTEKALQVARLSLIAEAATDPGLKAQLYTMAFQHARGIGGSFGGLEELVDLPGAKQVLGEARVQTEARARELEQLNSAGTCSVEELGELGRVYLSLGDPANAESTLRVLLARRDGDSVARLNLAVCLLAQERLEDASSELDRVRSHDVATEAKVLWLLSIRKGVQLPGAGDWDRASKKICRHNKHCVVLSIARDW